MGNCGTSCMTPQSTFSAYDQVASCYACSLLLMHAEQACKVRVWCADAAWETVGALTADEDETEEDESEEYKAITRQLHALSSGVQPGSGQEAAAAAMPAQASASPSSRLFNRTLGMFGWGAGGDTAGSAGDVAAAMHAEVL